jgi:peptidyl-prolyl cis-trans isomerase C
MSRIFREPLLHMALAGLLLFGVWRWVSPRTPGRRIDVSAEVLRGLRADHTRRTGAVPTADEEAALVRRYVEAEALYREALSLALDRGDVIVRRRLVQKMELLAQGLGEPRDPDDATLETFLSRHREKYATPALVSFDHVFTRTPAEAETAAKALAGGGDPARLGTAFAHGRSFTAQSAQQLDGRFGPGFGAQLATLTGDGWSAPLRSSYGWHLVRISARTAPHAPTLTELRPRLRQDYLDAERTRLGRAEIDRVVARYQVRVEAVQ